MVVVLVVLLVAGVGGMGFLEDVEWWKDGFAREGIGEAEGIA